MDYGKRPQYHFKPRRGWMNDPNGLVWFQGYYHVFYQHAPHWEVPWKEPMCWGHARTKDFLHWEELPVALVPDREYDCGGCWSGTAAVRDGVLYLFYASVRPAEAGAAVKYTQTVSVAFSRDGIHFEKYAGNPVIDTFPPEGGPDFRDPAVLVCGDKLYLVMASGNPQDRAARLLLYESGSPFDWRYVGVMAEWENARYAECPSFLRHGDKYLLTVSVCKLPQGSGHFFTMMYGDFDGRVFTCEASGSVDCGPDQYAGQAFSDPQGRSLLLSWTPGWSWKGFAERDIGCLSLPKEIVLRDGTLTAVPAREVRHLLRESDPLVRRTEDGFCIDRTLREPVVYRGEVRSLEILRDEYLLEVFVNGGEHIFTAVIC